MRRVSLGLGEYRAGKAGAEQWFIYGLGSCVGLILCDPTRQVSAMAHVVLPEKGRSLSGEPAKYADTAVPFLLEQMERLGAERSSVYAQMAGGARMLAISGLGDIGGRNAAALRETLAEHGIPLVAERVGGTQGRTLRWDLSTGRAVVSRVGAPDEILTPQQYVYGEVPVYGRSASR
ncbi:MAG: chemotaxis protein CheD [Firmicutes bacterium]|nr:chemotaxis protein CheD [Bacillota bacterium]